MLSIQNSSPLIPQLEISGLKGSTDETAVPSSSSFDHNNNKVISIPELDPTTITKFSIRDYVFNSRSKDIKNSWPFSEKNLQICLKNGVKDLLPPFQSTDSMRNHYNNNSCVGEEEDEVVVNNGSQPEPPIFPIPCSSSVIINKPTENTRQATLLPPSLPPVKKCRVVNRLDTNSKELVDTMNFADHAMVSKICPVCKTFSSSSNTTLNAHIDQCLSTESSNNKRASSEPKATTTTTVIKNRIKSIRPRKMRLMVDIYVTARHCTLEELDRRNGRSWATRPMPVPEEVIRKAHEEKKHPVSKAAVQRDNSSDDGEVYIDANGTKLRILSKSDDKPVEGCTTNKIPTANKKRLHLRHHHMQKLQKYLKLADPQSKRPSFQKYSNNPEIPRDSFTSRKSCNVIEKPEKFKAQQQKKDRDFTPIRKWACAKRTHFLNRTSRKEDAPQTLVLDRQSSDDPVMAKSSSSKRIRNSFESSTPISSPESSERMEKTHDKVKQPLNRISSFHGGLKSDTLKITDAGCGQPNKGLDLHNSSSEESKKLSSFHSLPSKSSEGRITILKKMRTSNSTGEGPEGINHSSSPQTVGSLSSVFPNSDFRKEGADQTSLSNSLVNPLCLLEDNMSDDHDHLYGTNHEMGNIPLMELEEVHHEIVGNESTYFDGVDPIPIPGPPGSFLPSPSPMDMGGADEELHGNSSLTNSRPESCENPLDHDHVNRDSSDSPTSLASTVSSRENFSKVNPPDSTNTVIHSEKTNQLCCCARKDQDQDCIWKQIRSNDPNRIRLDQDDGRDESLKNLKLDPDLIVKYPVSGECSTSVSPSSPNPVLRLMGKNLMVVNKDDNSLIQQQHHHHRPQWSGSINPVQQQMAVTVSANARNRGSFDHHITAYQQAPGFNLSEYNRVVESQPFDIRSYNNGFDNPLSHMAGSYTYINEPPFRKAASSSSTSAYDDHSMKEIIVIDDTPERKTDSVSEAMHIGGGGTRLNRVRPNGISIPMLPANNIISSREKILPFYGYHHHHQTQNLINLPYGGILPMSTTTTNNGSFQMPMMRLNRNPEGPSTMQTVAATTLPSTRNPGGTAMLYYSRGLS